MTLSTTRLEENSILSSVRRLAQFSEENLRVSADVFTLPSEELKDYALDVISLKNLIQKLPARLGTDLNRSLQQWNIDPALKTLIEYKLPSTFGMFRPDIVITQSGPKIVEFNIDVSALGLQTGVYAKAHYRQLSHHWFQADQLLNDYWLSKRPSRVIIWDIERAETDLYGKQLLGIFRQFSIPVEKMTASQILALSAEEIQSAHITRIFADARFIESAELQRNALEIHAKAPCSNHEYGVTNVLADSKVSMAFLWNLVREQKISHKEATLIRKYIPETHLLNSGKSLAMDQKDQWVLKSSHGFQGKEVYIGKELSQSQWEETLSSVDPAKSWILQKFEIPLPMKIGVVSKNGLELHAISHLFNMFFVNDQFGGALIRAALNGENKVGPVDGINCLSVPVIAQEYL